MRLIGTGIIRLFGCTLGQSMFYFSSFPQDLKSLKALVRSFIICRMILIIGGC